MKDTPSIATLRDRLETIVIHIASCRLERDCCEARVNSLTDDIEDAEAEIESFEAAISILTALAEK